MGAQNQILGPHFESFFYSLFTGHFLHPFLCGIIDSWKPQNKGSERNVLQKQCFRKNLLLGIRGSIFNVFWSPWEQFF